MHPTILIADDHPLVAEALRLRVLADMPRANVITVWSLQAALEQASRLRRLSLVLLDLMLPDAKGYSGLLLMRQSAKSAPVAIVSARQDPDAVSRARLLGAAGFLSKSLTQPDYAEAIRALLAGRNVFPASNVQESESNADAIDTRVDLLSAAQLRVLFAATDGQLNKQVAGEMGLSEATVKAHMSAVLRKLGLSSRVEAITLARSLLDFPVHACAA